MKKVLFIESIIFLVFLAFLILSPSSLNIPYFYLVYGSIFIFLPIVVRLLKYPQETLRFLPAIVYFFYTALLYEIAALKLGWWDFPGNQFIGWISIVGLRFPIEEFIFFVVLFSAAVLSYYKFVADER